jgi:small subunit ribosomal protein S16
LQHLATQTHEFYYLQESTDFPMLKLRLKRLGKKREVSYRIVVAQSTSRRDGRPVAEVGFHNPRADETRLDEEAVKSWLQKGAQPTDTVRSLLVKANLLAK